MDSLASRYANALLSICVEENLNAEYRKEIKDIYEAFSNSQELLNVLKSAFISKEEKLSLIDNILKDEEYLNIVNFIKVIIENNRANQLLTILNEFIKLSNLKDNISEGFVYSTYLLSNDEIKSISSSIETKLSKQVHLTNKVDPSLIGGIKVIVDDYVFDGSIKNQLKALKANLNKGV